MRDSSEITIQKAIVHLIELDESSEKKAKVLTLSAGEIPVAGDVELKKFFAAYITKNLSDSKARTANFVSDGENASQVMQPAHDILDRKKDFTKNTQAIVTRLHKVSHGNTSPGAVLFLQYKAKNKPDESFLAILVLSKTTGFQKTEVEKDGKVYIRFEKIEDLIPSADARLLKCAFICYRDPDQEEDDSYDMVVLDVLKKNDPADYFPVRFLGAKWFKESEQLTKDFYLAAHDALKAVSDDISLKKAGQLKKSIDVAVNGNEIDVSKWVENLNVKKEVKEVFTAKLSQRIPDPSFATDHEIAKKLTAKRVFRGAFDFRMSINSVGFDKSVKFKKDEEGNEYLEIRIPDLIEVPK